MSQINPFIGSILQTPNAQRQAAADRDKQLRRAVDTAKNAYLTEDRLELSVESSDRSEEAGDEQKRREHSQKRRRSQEEDDPDHEPHLDLKA